MPLIPITQKQTGLCCYARIFGKVARSVRDIMLRERLFRYYDLSSSLGSEIQMARVMKPRGHMGKTIRFKSQEDHQDFLRDFCKTHPLSKLHSSGHVILNYVRKKYDFSHAIYTLLKEKQLIERDALSQLSALEDLHTITDPALTTLDDSELNQMSRCFYESSDDFLDIYRRFMDQVVAPLVGEPIYYQKTPTVRFQFPNQKGYNWVERLHTDIMLGHPPEEYNIWVPLTTVSGTNSMLLSPVKDSMTAYRNCNFDFELFAQRVQYDSGFVNSIRRSAAPIELDRGQFITFDPRCLHGTQYNDTPSTRISIDARVLAVETYKNTKRRYRGTGRRRLQFIPGQYFDSDPVGCGLA